MAIDWGDIFRRLQIIANEQHIAEEETDIGEDNEDYVEKMLRKEDTIAVVELTNRLPSRTTYHPWLLKVRNNAIISIVQAGGTFGVRKITLHTAIIYVDRFLSSMPIEHERFEIANLLAMACLYLACEQLEEHEHQKRISAYEKFVNYRRGSLLNMRHTVVTQFGGIVNFVTPIHFIKYFLSKFCKNLERKEYARIKSVEVIMSTLGDVRLMSLRAFIVGAAATLLASNPSILTQGLIRDEINALPTNWLIPLDEVCSCYNRLLETNRHRLDIN